MKPSEIASAYKRWAPVYDQTFGLITRSGRRRAVEHINRRRGTVLEVGVGTGIALPFYAPHLDVTGVDFSPDMLDRARRKVAEERLSHVSALRQMDARHLDFPDGSFDTVVAMFLVSVVPEPERVVAEMARVCKPGGEVLIVNHFASDAGLLAMAERALAPFSGRIGWHSDFPRDRVLSADGLELTDERPLPPLGVFTFLRLMRTPASQQTA